MESNIKGLGCRTLQQFGVKTGQLDALKNVLDSKSLNEFVRKLARIGEDMNCEGYEVGKTLQECTNKVKGDLFEVFTVIWLNSNGGDMSLRIQNVKWAIRDQIGFDFTAVDSNGRTTFIQSKFHSSNEEFESDRLETFFIEGNNVEGPVTRVLFTTASKVSQRYRRAHREGNLIVIDRKKLKDFADTGFWKYCQDVSEKLFS